MKKLETQLIYLFAFILIFNLNLKAQYASGQLITGIADNNSSDFSQLSLGISLEYLHPLNKYIDLSLGTGIIIQNLKDGKASLIPFICGFRINMYKLKISSGEKYFLPYIGLGMGYVLTGVNQKINTDNGGLGFSILAGSKYDMTPNLGLDINIKLNGYYWGMSEHKAFTDIIYALYAGVYYKL